MFGLSESELELVAKLVVEPIRLKGGEVWVFGSRANGSYKPFSDLDLLLEIKSDKNFLRKIKEDIEESYLPYKVDLVLIDDLADSYSTTIHTERIKFP